MPVAEVAVERQARDIGQRQRRRHPVVLVAGRGQRALADPVEAVGERDDVAPAGHLAGQLERGLDGVRPGRPGELHPVVQPRGSSTSPSKASRNAAFGAGEQVQAVRDAVALDVRDQRGGHVRIVVPVVERSGAGQEVDVLPAVDVPDQAARARSNTASYRRQ